MASPNRRQRDSHDDVVRYWKQGGEIKKRFAASDERSLSKWIEKHRQGESKDKVYKMVQLATAIETEDELQQLLELGKVDQGQLLLWNHFIVLMTVRKRRERLRLARIASQEALSPQALRLLIPSSPDSAGSRRGGRKLKPPSDLASGIQQLRKNLITEVRRLERLLQDNEIHEVRTALLELQGAIMKTLDAIANAG